MIFLGLSKIMVTDVSRHSSKLLYEPKPQCGEKPTHSPALSEKSEICARVRRDAFSFSLQYAAIQSDAQQQSEQQGFSLYAMLSDCSS